MLKATRMAELSTELRTLRLLLEARALSDMKRTDLALEVIANIDRREAIRLRSDILWAGKRYGKSAEQIELLYGERWKDFEPLGDAERSDILRAAIGYALAEDAIGLGRLREKYTPKMTDAADRRAFEIATAPFGANATEFREVSKMVATSDTLGTFLREMRAGYPELGAVRDRAGQSRTAKGRDAHETGGPHADRIDPAGSAQAQAVRADFRRQKPVSARPASRIANDGGLSRYYDWLAACREPARHQRIRRPKVKAARAGRLGLFKEDAMTRNFRKILMATTMLAGFAIFTFDAAQAGPNGPSFSGGSISGFSSMRMDFNRIGGPGRALSRERAAHRAGR